MCEQHKTTKKMGSKGWERIAWNDEHQQLLYRDWGVYYSHKQQFKKAAICYNKSLELKNDDLTALYYRSISKRDVVQPEHALDDALLALCLNNMSYGVNIQMCDALYEANKFEQCRAELTNSSRKFSGQRVLPFRQRMAIVEKNLSDNAGYYAGRILNKNHKNLNKIIYQVKQKKTVVSRPAMKENHSVLLKEYENLNARGKAKLEQNNKIFAQIYLQKGWKDVEFLKALKKNKQLFLPQSKRTTPYLAKVISENFEIVNKCLKMLQARNPLFRQRYNMCPNPKLAAKAKEAHLFHVQYQTRRDMFNTLNKVHNLRKEGDIEKLAQFIEKSMGDYFETKTTRVMPRKFQFTNEIYNIFALAYCDQLVVPENIMMYPVEDRLLILMRVRAEKKPSYLRPHKRRDNSTHEEPDAIHTDNTAYKKITSRYESRLRFATYSIEKCYLLHEIANQHLYHGKPDEARMLGKKVIEEANLCHNYVWNLLGALIICKADVIQRKLEKIKDNFIVVKAIADRLGNSSISYFVDTCVRFNQEALELRQNFSEDFLLKGREKFKPNSQLQVEN